MLIPILPLLMLYIIKLPVKQINLLHIPLFEFDVNALDGSLAEYFDQKYKKRLLWLSVFYGEQFFACKVH